MVKWIACEHGLMTLEEYEDVILSAIGKRNYGLPAFLFWNVLDMEKCNLGFIIATTHWKYLKDKNRASLTLCKNIQNRNVYYLDECV